MGTGVFGIYKTNYVVFTTEFAGEIVKTPAVCENGVESAAGTCARITNVQLAGCNGGTGGVLASERAHERKTCSFAAGTGIFGIYKTNYVVFTTEFAGESTEAPAVCENSV